MDGWMDTGTYTYICMSVNVCVYVCMYIGMYVQMDGWMDGDRYKHACTHMYLMNFYNYGYVTIWF